MCVNVYLINFKYEMRMKALIRPPIRSRVTLRIRFTKLQESFTLSFPTPDRVEGDVKDMVYQTVGIAFFVRGIPNQVGNDIVDKFQGDSGS